MFGSLPGIAEPAAAVMVSEASKFLSHPDRRFRTSAAMAIGLAKVQTNNQSELLRKLLDDTTEDQSQIINSIAGIEPKSPSTFRIPACAAMSALASLGDELCVPKMVEYLESYTSPPEVRRTAAEALGQISINGKSGRATEEDSIDALMMCLSAPQAELRA